MRSEFGLSTSCVHAGEIEDAHGSPHTPLYTTTTFKFASTADIVVTQPCTTTHHWLTADERTRRGISDAMLRLSIGLEDAADLIADLDQALT